MQRCKVEPYKGNRPYLFVSYSHKEEDKAIVYPILERMEQAGFRLWFDQGIEATSEWAAVVCSHLKAASACLFCLSKNFAASGNCRDELYLAKNGAAKRVTLFLKSDTELDPELEMGLVRQEQIFLENYSDIDELVKYLKRDENLQACLGASAPAQESRKAIVFNAARIRKELQDETFLAAKQAYKDCEFQKAMDLYHKAYANGNGTAGTLLGAMYNSGDYCPIDYERAAQIFVDCVHRDNPLAVEWLASCYKYGDGVPKDAAKAQMLFADCQDALEEMAILGSEDAQYHLGYDFLYGEFCDAVPERGLYWLKKAAAAGYGLAGYDLAVAKIEGKGCSKDVDVGIAELNRDTKDPDSAYFTAMLLQEGIDGRKPNEKTAFHLFLYAAQKGHISAQGYLGDCYYFGKGTDINYEESLRWHQRAASGGDIESLNALGVQYLFAQGVTQNVQKAISFFTQALQKGHPFGAYMLGLIYCGLPDGCLPYKDLPKAVRFLQESADSSSFNYENYKNRVEPVETLMKCYRGDYGKEVLDMPRYYAMLQKAADLGDAESMYLLGCMLVDGSGEPTIHKDPYKGDVLINKAAKKNHHDAILYQARANIETLAVQALRAALETPPQQDKAFSLLQRADEIQTKNDIEDGHLSLEALCLLGRAYMQLGCPNLKFENLADVTFKTLPEQKLVFLTCAYRRFCFALRKDKTRADVLSWMAILQLFAGFSNDAWDDDTLLGWLKKEAPNDSSLASILGAYYETHKQEDEMVYWYKIAAKEHPKIACRLGRYCVEHRTHGQDAMQVLLTCGGNSDAEVGYLIGCLYRYGIGVEKSRGKAKDFLRMAANMGSKEAAADLRTFWF